MGACPPCQSAQQGTPHSSSAAPLECFPRAWLPFLRSSPKLTVLYFVRPVPVVQYSRDSRGLDHHLWPPPYCESSVALATLISRWHPPNTGMTDMSAAVMSAPHAREIRLLGKSALPCCRACCSLHGSATHTHTHTHTHLLLLTGAANAHSCGTYGHKAQQTACTRHSPAGCDGLHQTIRPISGLTYRYGIPYK